MSSMPPRFFWWSCPKIRSEWSNTYLDGSYNKQHQAEIISSKINRQQSSNASANQSKQQLPTSSRTNMHNMKLPITKVQKSKTSKTVTTIPTPPSRPPPSSLDSSRDAVLSDVLQDSGRATSPQTFRWAKSHRPCSSPSLRGLAALAQG